MNIINKSLVVSLAVVLAIIMPDGLAVCFAETTITLYSAATLDGTAYSSIAAATSDSNLEVGDRAWSAGARGFVSFDITTLGAKGIASAVFRLNQTAGLGDPYNDLGDEVRVDHLDYGAALDGGDYNAAALTTNIGLISTNATSEWKTLDVTAYVQNDMNNLRTRSQFRLYFPDKTDDDNNGDYTLFTTGDSGTNKPELVVTFSDNAIPTLSEWGLIIFMLLLAVAALWTLRRRDTDTGLT
ncbi:MAG: IPTL-CTERM sorting domain-containing protein [Deltaproteobacteria bacterium]|nr:IPTL-CTERM sorting domain-containing protein [Deltaproteobacteria bacterium]